MKYFKKLIIAVALGTLPFLLLSACSQEAVTDSGTEKEAVSTAQDTDIVTDAQTEKETEAATKATEDTKVQEPEKYIPPRTVRIACVGDSITYGVGAGTPAINSYPAQLKSKLGSKYIVMNFGKSSSYMINPKEYPDFKFASTRSVAYTSTEEYQNSLTSAPDMVFICLGANDAYISNTNSEIEQEKYFFESAVALAQKYQSLESKPTVYFMYPPARYDAQYRLDYIKSTIIPMIDAAARECGCEVIDLFSLTEEYARTKNLSYFTSDGIHLADKGYTVMAEAVYKVASEYRIAE